MKIIKGIGFEIPSESDSYVKLDSLDSLADVDIAIFSPNLSVTDYQTSENYDDGQYAGKKRYNKRSSALIIDHSSHWKSEIHKLLEAGRTIYVILEQVDRFYVYSGSNSVSEFSNYHFLPFSPQVEFRSASGKTVIPEASLIVEFFNNFKDLISHETYITSSNPTQRLFTTKNKDRILGASQSYQKGHVIFLPKISFDDKRFEKLAGNGSIHWNSLAIKRSSIFINSLVEIEKAITGAVVKTTKPSWVESESFQLAQSEKTKSKIVRLEADIEKKRKELEKMAVQLNEQESLKDLLFETGKALELAVIQALKILGYSAEQYSDGGLELDQVIISPEGQRFIGECEGRDSKDIDVTKFRQLLDGLGADFERGEVTEKAFGLLFGNAERLIDPSQRRLDFTTKCKTGAARERIGLVKTVDLFHVCKLVAENDDGAYAKLCRAAIFDQLGAVVIFPPYTKK